MTFQDERDARKAWIQDEVRELAGVWIENEGPREWGGKTHIDAEMNVDAIACDDCGVAVGHYLVDGDYGGMKGMWNSYFLTTDEMHRYCEDCADARGLI